MTDPIKFDMLKCAIVSETTKQTEKDTTTTYSYTFRKVLKGGSDVEVTVKSDVELDLSRGEIRDFVVNPSSQQKLN